MKQRSVTKHMFYLIMLANARVKKMPDNINVVEGERLQIHCKALGTNTKITWYIGKF